MILESRKTIGQVVNSYDSFSNEAMKKCHESAFVKLFNKEHCYKKFEVKINKEFIFFLSLFHFK